MKTLGIAALVVGALFIQPAALAHEDGPGRGPGLEGVWVVKLAPKDCTTGTPFPVPALINLFTFHEDGTLAASMQNYAISGTNRSLSHGLWKQRSSGRRGEFAMTFTHLRYDFASGLYLGTQVAVTQVALDRSGDRFLAAGSTKGIDANGNEEYTGCSNMTGERMLLR